MHYPISKGFLAIVLSATALAAPARAEGPLAGKARYHFRLAAVTAKAGIKPEVAKVAIPKLEAEVKKAFDQHPQLVTKLEGAPDPSASAGAYRSYLAKNRIAGAYKVSVEITDATEKSSPATDKANAQVLEIRVTIRMLGERIPEDTLGFNGRGNTIIKQEVGPKVRDEGREAAWKDAAEVVVEGAMKTAFEQLAEPAKGPPKAKR